MSPINTPSSGRSYWRSLAELSRSPEFLAELGPEFAEGADLPPQGTSRRQFLQVMAASVSLAGLAGCRYPKENIYPYANRPDNRLPGVPVKYATCMDLGGVAKGLLATSYDGRPIKIDGNDFHPDNLGANDIWAEASVLELYDPDRSRNPVSREQGQEFNKTWDDFLAFSKTHFGQIRAQQGQGLAVLSEASSSPSLARMKSRFLAAFPQAKWHEYEPVSRENERAGTALVFGQPCRPLLSLEKAKVIVALDGDLLAGHPAALRQARDYVAGRAPDGQEMSRLYAIESAFTLTGANADHRYPVPASLISVVAARLAIELVKQGLSSPLLPQTLLGTLEKASEGAVQTPFVPAIAKDILSRREDSLITVGERQPAEVHALVHLLNAALGNTGRAIRYTADPEPNRPSHRASIQALAQDLAAGEVKTLLILGGNPAYNAPSDLNFAEAIQKAGTSIHLSLRRDETSLLCTWHVPLSHYLESWGDGRAYDGTLCCQQPLIRPLYEGKSAIEFLSLVTEESQRSGYDIVRETVLPLLAGSDPEVAWREFLNKGIQEGTAAADISAAARPDQLAKNLAQTSSGPHASDSNLEVIFLPDASLYDGRFANNGWLQELPDFLTKVTWDNAALIAPSTAERLGVKQGELIVLSLHEKTLTIAAYIMPGQAPNSIGLQLGYGRAAAGRVGNGVGFNTYTLRTSAAPDFETGVTVQPTGQTYILACTQDHHAIDTIGAAGRDERLGALVREADIEDYKHHPDFAKHAVHMPKPVQLWEPFEYKDNAWGMAVDLQKCIGCNACVVACQAENNIPVVGKEQVWRQREMHWLRVDRYFKGEADSPSVAHQPVACVHCENAPCEQVCPVGATVHDHDGLNIMVYNRCIGTRYCSNNCPYKVRRFNFFHYHLHETDTEKMVFNPDVSARSRGVMEKCNYCIQRIERTKIAAKNEGRPIADGEIRTACQVACPTGAIVFGDLNNTKSQVKRLQGDPRSYLLLEDLNVRPRTAHLARVTNPNPDLIEKAAHEQPSHG